MKERLTPYISRRIKTKYNKNDYIFFNRHFKRSWKYRVRLQYIRRTSQCIGFYISTALYSIKLDLLESAWEFSKLFQGK